MLCLHTFPLLSFNLYNYIFLIVRALPWSDARAHCQALGTDLAEMNTRAEQSGVTRYLNNYREFSLKEEIVWSVASFFQITGFPSGWEEA